MPVVRRAISTRCKLFECAKEFLGIVGEVFGVLGFGCFKQVRVFQHVGRVDGCTPCGPRCLCIHAHKLAADCDAFLAAADGPQ